MIAILFKHCGWGIGYSKLEQSFCSNDFESMESLLQGCYFPQKWMRYSALVFHENSVIVALRFSFQESRVKKKKWKWYFKNKKKKTTTDFRESKYVYKSPIIEILFHTKICALLRRGFPPKFLNCGLVKTLKPKNSKIPLMTYSIYLKPSTWVF